MRVVSVSLPEELVQRVDRLAQQGEYSGRSQVFRAALRPFLDVSESDGERTGHATATLTLCYEESESELVNRRRHEHGDPVTTMVHGHIEEHRCLEVLVLEGQAGQIRDLADDLRGRKGVHQVELIWTS